MAAISKATASFLLGICLLLDFLLLGEVNAVPCETGRFYLGNINLNHLGLVGSNGVYTLNRGQTYNNRPVYTHTNRHLYMYFASTDMDTYWVVASNVTSNLSDVRIRMSSAADQPITTTDTKWQLKEHGVWNMEPKLKTYCVDNDFGPCTSGKINISGLPVKSRGKERFMGVYSLYNISQSLRPVYIKDGGQEKLFYNKHGLWVFSNDLSSNSMAMFTKDSAFLPEFILAEWAYFSGFGLRSQKLDIKCVGEDDAGNFAVKRRHNVNPCPPGQRPKEQHEETPLSSSSPSPLDSENDTPKDRTQPDNPSEHDSPEEQAPSVQCQPEDACENGGEVTETGSGLTQQVVCKCKEGYYGIHCEKEIRCGPAPDVAMATLQDVVQEGLLVMAIYKCNHGYHSDVGLVAVCGMDTRWLYLPKCRSNIYSGYDWSDVAP